MTDDLTRTLEAEIRAVEEGHHALSLDGPGRYRVVSDVRPTEWRYTVHVTVGIAAGHPGPVVYAPDLSCDHLEVQGIGLRPCRSRRPGLTPCKHAALVCRRLSREGLLTFDLEHGWTARDAAALRAAVTPPRRPTVTDADLFDV